MEKYQHDDVVGLERENERDENYRSRVNPQIDRARTHLNYHVVKKVGTYLDYIHERIRELNPKRKVKADAVLVCSFILGASPEFFKGKSPGEIRDFFYASAEFFSERYGLENIISAVVHLDESTPHMHLNMIPVTGGRLCAKELFDRTALRDLQTDYYESVGKKYGLDRGNEGSTAKHLDTVTFKTKKMKEEAIAKVLEADERERQAQEKISEAERLQREVEPIKKMLDDYEQAKSEKIPFSGKKKESEIIALRTKNKELSGQNATLASDNDFLFKEMKKQERKAEEFSSAAEVVKRLAEYAPEEFAYAQKMANERKAQKGKSSFSSKKNWWTK